MLLPSADADLLSFDGEFAGTKSGTDDETPVATPVAGERVRW